MTPLRFNLPDALTREVAAFVTRVTADGHAHVTRFSERAHWRVLDVCLRPDGVTCDLTIENGQHFAITVMPMPCDCEYEGDKLAGSLCPPCRAVHDRLAAQREPCPCAICNGQIARPFLGAPVFEEEDDGLPF